MLHVPNHQSIIMYNPEFTQGFLVRRSNQEHYQHYRSATLMLGLVKKLGLMSAGLAVSWRWIDRWIDIYIAIENGDLMGFIRIYDGIASGKRSQFANWKPWPSRNSGFTHL